MPCRHVRIAFALVVDRKIDLDVQGRPVHLPFTPTRIVKHVELIYEIVLVARVHECGREVRPKRAIWERDRGSCTWPMGDGKLCGSTHQLEFDHDLEVALGGEPTIDNIRLLCKSHNLMKAENHLGRELMARFRGDLARARPSTAQK